MINKTKPGLAVDTRFSRHNGQAPKQIFPCEPQAQDLSPVTGDAQASRLRNDKEGLKQLKSKRVPDSTTQQSTAEETNQIWRNKNNMNAEPYWNNDATNLPCPAGKTDHRPPHKRIKGLRPSPLDLTLGVSPSDHAIPIVLALPPGMVPSHTWGSNSYVPYQQRSRQRPEESSTPFIVITPAKEDFDFTKSPEETKHSSRYRPSSSVYSRYTNFFSTQQLNGCPGPVPPVPVIARTQSDRKPAVSASGEEIAITRSKSNQAFDGLSEGDEPGRNAQFSARLERRSSLPTLRRSRGWWNVLLSPLSAGSKYNAFSWLSPSLTEVEEDLRHILQDGLTGNDYNYQRDDIFPDLATGEEELRTALPPETGSQKPTVPKRSHTAPGALDLGSKVVNIYHVPSQGSAAAYYDSNKQFPNVLVCEFGETEGVYNFAGMDAFETAAREGSGDFEASVNPDTSLDGDCGTVDRGIENEAHIAIMGADNNTVEDFLADDEKDGRRLPHGVFSTPSPEELIHASPQSLENDQYDGQGSESYFSPLSATPIVEDAQFATLVGPHINRESKEVQMISRPPSAQIYRGLAAATMASRSVDHTGEIKDQPTTVGHYRSVSSDSSSNSTGLGITDANIGNKELHSSTPIFGKKSTWNGDQYCNIPKIEQMDLKSPFYHRFFWILVGLGAAALLLLTTLMIVLIPLEPRGMGVEAEWLNLTAFPPMVTGITTVINSAPVTDVSGCVNPQSVWSCDSPPPGYQVNFRFEIRFRNDTLPKNETQIAKRGIYSSNPATPSNNDQFFIGEYTDNVTAPYNGELTPFYISLLNASALTENSDALDKRQSAPYPYPTADDESVSLNASTTAPKTIPRPLLSEDGSPAQSILYPFAAAQPLRLYNRGQSDEHYGFYTYFDRTIYTSSFYPNSSGALELENEARSNEVLANATAVCTWSQTRLHVQIWTRKTNVATLSDRMPLDSLRAINSTANDMLAPGSFPMPVTISLVRRSTSALSNKVCASLTIVTTRIDMAEKRIKKVFIAMG